MKMNRVLGAVLAVSFMVVSATSVSAAELDRSAYGYLTGKEGRTGEAVPYAGMNYEVGEQGAPTASAPGGPASPGIQRNNLTVRKS